MTSLGGILAESLVIILVHASLSVSGLRTAGPLGHDDLIHPEDSAGGVGGVLQGPLLGKHQIQYVGLQAVLKEGKFY